MMNEINTKDLWIDTKLSQEEMDFLWECISEENKENWNCNLAGNISKSELIVDKDNWFFKSAIKKLTERMFYRDWDNFSKYHIGVEEGVSLPEFEMNTFWVNYQKQHEFNPLHNHSGLYSFVIFMKIPTHWKEQHELSISAASNSPHASDFQFVWSEEGHNQCLFANFNLSSEDEGRMLFFPASLQHQVYPFYGTEEERITISGNICLYKLEPDKVKLHVDGRQYEKKQNALKILESTVEEVKKELKYLKNKQAGSKDEANPLARTLKVSISRLT